MWRWRGLWLVVVVLEEVVVELWWSWCKWCVRLKTKEKGGVERGKLDLLLWYLFR